MNTTTETATTTGSTDTTRRPKSASITLKAAGSTMVILATRKADGSATTTVLLTDDKKQKSRGMTDVHANFEDATAAIGKLATNAQKLGWTRAVARRGFTPKPDAFSALPAAPKPVAKKK